MNGLITNIQRMSIHDGPGIRSVIFMKGCNLRCKWCHNPETFVPAPEVEWISGKCIHCGVCTEVCRYGALQMDAGMVHFDKAKCTACFECIPHCYPEALQKIGREVSPEETLAEIRQDFPYFEASGGGVTISGGEPMLQPGYVRQTLGLFQEAGIHTALETNLTVAWDQYEALLPYTDLLMADLKVVDSDIHKRWTGAGNRRILANIDRLDRSGIPYLLRTPVVPGFNHTEEHIEKIARLVARLENIRKFELLPFHPMADTKYKNLGIDNPFRDVKGLTPEDLNVYKPILKKYNLIYDGNVNKI